ncbi:MAG TPA: flagellar export chaperone FliS, partial [Polyangia bacterium]
MNVARTYARTQNETASKERLMVLLFEAGLRHMRAGATAFAAGKRADAVKSIGKASDIVQELLATLKPEVFPELCDRLAAIYIFVLGRLDRALLTLTAKPAEEAARAFEPIVTGFAEAVGKLERGEAARP